MSQASWQRKIIDDLKIPQGSQQIWWMCEDEHLHGREQFLKQLDDVVVYHHGDFVDKTISKYKKQRVVVFCVLGADSPRHLDMVRYYVRNFKNGYLFDQHRGVLLFKPPQVIVFADFAAPDF